MLESLSDRYSHTDVEKKQYQWWMERNYFAAKDQSTKIPFAVTLPPPNVTGSLHIGHALDSSIQDCLIRWKRMCGFNAMWMPGVDHAGIATQSVVEKMLWKERKTSRQELGREAFTAEIWRWKEKYGDRIVEQMQAMGFSVDWARMRFTLDEKSNQAVRKVFVSLYQQGLIYRGTRLVNWSPKLGSAISDLEVEHQDSKGSLWHIAYPIEGTNEQLVVATTRPETLLGDTAVAVNPDDERYQQWIGKSVRLPLSGRNIPIIADNYVDKEFGSGVVKITPAHDFNDYEVGKRHNLPMINILHKDGILNENAGAYQGLSVAEARTRVLQDLEAAGLLLKEEAHQLKTPLCSRTGCVVEPLLSDQWFVAIDKLAAPAKHVVQSGTIQFEPESYTKVYLHWMNQIEDWCISRQLWWGHRIPVWYCQDCGKQSCSEDIDLQQCQHCGSSKIEQDPDVLDTWFSSALWPFSTLGWPEDTEALKTFYPTDTLVTGHDILFFWVARMIMMGLHFQKDVPFRTVYLHGLVRDAQGRKMSKSLGNSVDPLELIAESGADSLRFTLLQQVASGKDLKFSKQRLEGNRNFMNKLWNASRFVLNMALENFVAPEIGEKALPDAASLSVADRWILFKLNETCQQVNRALGQYRFSEAANLLYSFTWNDFCDWYLEFSKPVIYGPQGKSKEVTQLVLVQTLNRILRLLHPFIPHITEEIYQKLPLRSEACIIADYPSTKTDADFLNLGDEQAAKEMDLVRDCIVAIRNIRGENRISHSQKIPVRLAVSKTQHQDLLERNRQQILNLAVAASLEISSDSGELQKCAVSPLELADGPVQLIVALEGLVDFDEEIKRLQQNLDKTERELLSLEKKLGNEYFLKNAPEEVVENDKQQLGMLQAQRQTLQESLARLQ